MATLTYVGRAPDSDGTVAPKSYADTTAQAAVVTTTIVNNLIASNAALLTTQGYVDSQNALLAKQTDVTAADQAYVPTTKLNVASGVAGLDSSGNLLTAQTPSGILTDRVHKAYAVAFPSGQTGALGGVLSSVPGAVGVPYLTAATTVHTTSARELRIASVVIPDPGYPWRPLPFGWISGNSSGATKPATRVLGTGNYGLLTVMPPSGVSNQIYGVGICSGSYYTNHYPILPYAASGQTPSSVPAIVGGLELDLYGCCWSGTTYTYLPQDLAFWVLVVPAM